MITTSLIDIIIDKKIPYIITAHDGWWMSSNRFIINNEGVQEYYDYRNSVNQSKKVKTLKPYLESAAAITTVSEAFKNIHENCGVENIINTENGIIKEISQNLREFLTKKLCSHIWEDVSFHKGLGLVEKILKESSFENLEFTYIDYAKTDDLIKD